MRVLRGCITELDSSPDNLISAQCVDVIDSCLFALPDVRKQSSRIRLHLTSHHRRCFWSDQETHAVEEEVVVEAAAHFSRFNLSSARASTAVYSATIHDNQLSSGKSPCIPLALPSIDTLSRHRLSHVFLLSLAG